MNILFWLIIAVLVIIAVLIVVLPLLKSAPAIADDSEQQNIAIARQRLHELKQQLEDGVLTEEQYQLQYQELQQCLNDDLAYKPQTTAANSNGRWVIPVILLNLPLFSVFLYFDLADPNALQKQQVQQQQSSNIDEVNRLIPQIIERLKQNPDDLQGWFMLGRSYKFVERYQEAAKVFGKIYSLQPENPEAILNYAETLAVINNGKLSGEPANLAYKAVRISPDNKDALWMAGLAKAQEGDNAQASQYWQKLIEQLPADSDSVNQIRQMLVELGEQPSAQPAVSDNAVNIHVQVAVDEAVKNSLQAGQVVFIYAQAVSGPKMPLAIVRKQVADLPISVDLNDSMAMQPNIKLSDFKAVKIIARVSKSGTATTQQGDFIGSTEVSLPVDASVVNVSINQEVK